MWTLTKKDFLLLVRKKPAEYISLGSRILKLMIETFWWMGTVNGMVCNGYLDSEADFRFVSINASEIFQIPVPSLLLTSMSSSMSSSHFPPDGTFLSQLFSPDPSQSSFSPESLLPSLSPELRLPETPFGWQSHRQLNDIVMYPFLIIQFC